MNKKVVVAIFEDDEINRFICENLLKSKEDKIEAHVFVNPEDGYNAAKNTEFDIVFIETHFWGQNFQGVKILEKLREINSKPFISVAMTALLQEGDLEQLILSGFTICMEKPLSFENVERLQEVWQ